MLLNNLALAQEATGRADLAIATLQSILEFEPNSALAHKNLGAALIAHAKTAGVSPELALRHLQRAAELDPRDTRSGVLMADLLISLDRRPEAIDAYESVLRADPNMLEALDKLGTIYARDRRFQDSLRCFDRIVAVDPNATVIWIRIASINLLLQDPDKSQAALDQAKRLLPDDNYQLAPIQQRIDMLRNQLRQGDRR
jgi:tetratricopeptide (TPR) repeat protein